MIRTYGLHAGQYYVGSNWQGGVWKDFEYSEPFRLQDMRRVVATKRVTYTICNAWSVRKVEEDNAAGSYGIKVYVSSDKYYDLAWGQSFVVPAGEYITRIESYFILESMSIYCSRYRYHFVQVSR